jgi:hypothetical protein
MKKVIGEVAVDSGQILVCDPGYIDEQWKLEDCSFDRKHKHIDGTILQYRVDFENYGVIIPKYGKTMNQIIKDKEAIEMPESPAEHPFSYNACCKKTCNDDEDKNNGQLNFEMGYAGVGVVTSSGYGDGIYPVVADIDDKTGRVKSITVVFIDDEEDPFDDSEERRDFSNDDDVTHETFFGENIKRIKKLFRKNK